MKVKATQTQGDTPLTWESKGEFEESHHHSLCPYALWFHDKLKKGGPVSFVKWLLGRNFIQISEISLSFHQICQNICVGLSN